MARLAKREALTLQPDGRGDDLDDSADNLSAIKRLFQGADVDGTGKLERPEMLGILKDCLPSFTDEDLSELFDAADRNPGGLVDYGEILEFIFGMDESEAEILEQVNFVPATQPQLVISPPGLDGIAAQLRRELGLGADEGESPVTWERFKNGDPNVKYNWRAISGRRVIFLFDTIDQARFFEQMSLLQALQGFPLPDGEDADQKWKTYNDTGSYSWGRAAEIAIVIPWYRPCQMERTSRWERKPDGSWSNSDPEGSWLDVPNAQTYARLLITPGLPLPGAEPKATLDGRALYRRAKERLVDTALDVEGRRHDILWRPPVTLYFVELHEEHPVELAAGDLGVEVRMERFVGYFLSKFKASTSFIGADKTYVVFPDHGAYERYLSHAVDDLGLDLDHILWINKKRVGGAITQEKALRFDTGIEQGQKDSFNPDEYVMIIDDFTNSGSTLFGAVNLVRGMTPGGELNASIFVSHTVAAYDEQVLRGILKKLEELGPKVRFATTDTLPQSVAILENHPQVDVYRLAEFLADMLR